MSTQSDRSNNLFEHCKCTLILLCLIFLLFFFYVRRRKKKCAPLLTLGLSVARKFIDWIVSNSRPLFPLYNCTEGSLLFWYENSFKHLVSSHAKCTKQCFFLQLSCTFPVSKTQDHYYQDWVAWFWPSKVLWDVNIDLNRGYYIWNMLRKWLLREKLDCAFFLQGFHCSPSL